MLLCHAVDNRKLLSVSCFLGGDAFFSWHVVISIAKGGNSKYSSTDQRFTKGRSRQVLLCLISGAKLLALSECP